MTHSAAWAQYQLENAFPNLSFDTAVDIQALGSINSQNRLYVAEKRGVIYTFPEDIQVDPGQRTVFLDLTTKANDSGEAGLLGLALHPNFETNRYFFVYYVTGFPYRNIVARYRATADFSAADPQSELILIDEPKNTLFHNGGQLAFGPGNLLYIAMGDDTQSSNGQDLTDLFGSILRIAPNVAGDSPAYTIPNGNPFKGNPSGSREEIFAYGFRNPWRFSIDPGTGDVWVADVGENTYEEVDLVESGGNYGWPLMEGPDCFQPASCDTAGKGLSLPIESYTHGEGSAVIGGHVYHGTRLPELEGLYVFGDFSGAVWTLSYDGVNPPVRSDLATTGSLLLTIGVGNMPKRDVYLSSFDGSIYRVSRVVTDTGRAPDAAGNRLLGNFPNPFNPATTIRYQLAQPGRVAVEILAVDGSRVRMLEQGSRDAGAHDLTWRGETDAGGRAASGVYFYRLLLDGVARDTARMVLVQ
ncbi:MAG TPA: PQQ-dependent sugar dehydrogenase [Candidatus Krumholzibacteria bacterium]|nr:PQQ-dependent sugar dehydrogenase [Candidatus Krumholzibacteria bacterium]